MIQANYEALERVAQRFAQRAQANQQLYTAMSRQTRSLATTWEGKGAEAFQREMQQTVFPALQRLTKALEQGGLTTRKISQVVLQAEEEAARLFGGRGTGGMPLGKTTGGGGAGTNGATPQTVAMRFKPATQDQPVLTRDEYTQLAMQRAGIDPANWDPSRGFVHNQATIKAVYDYYRDLFLQDPNLMWAGMARVAGQNVFYPGFLQVNTLLQAAESPLRYALPPGTGPLADLSADSLRFLETKFLDMQQQIFMDMAWQHEAYLNGGIDTMRQLAANGDLAADQLASWEKIASGDPTLVAQGNRELLRREQFDIIQDDYEQISQGLFRADGVLVSLGLSFVAISPMPGGEPFQEVVPFGNLANFDDRWRWIDNDMLPRWVNIAQNDPAQAQALVNAPLNDSRVDAFANSAWGIAREEAENFVEGVENAAEAVGDFVEDVFSRFR